MEEMGVYIGFRSMSGEQYDGIMAKLKAKGLAEPAGRSYHMAVQEESTIHFFDIWDSQEEYEVFGSHLMAAVKDVGLEERNPIFVPTHNVVTG